MKSLTISVFLLVSTTQLFSQQLTKEAFLGSWKVVDSQLISEIPLGLDTEGEKKMEQLRTGFIGTIFNFKANNEFTIKFSDNIPEFMQELEFINNKKWKIEEGRMIAIGTEEDAYSLMGIIVETKQGKTLFILDETPFILEVTEQ
jgi:hypothetical protein